MWIPTKLLPWLSIAEETRAELAAVRAERDLLRSQLAIAQTNFDWLRARTNTLELENRIFLQRAYNISVPVPEVARQPVIDPSFDPRNFDGFEDVGDDLAKRLGLPVHGSN